MVIIPIFNCDKNCVQTDILELKTLFLKVKHLEKLFGYTVIAQRCKKGDILLEKNLELGKFGTQTGL